MYEDLADFSIKYVSKLGASYAEARLEHHSGNSSVLKNGILEGSELGVVQGMGIRFIINKTLGFISVNEFKKEKIKEIISKAIRLTKYSSRIKEPISLADTEILSRKYKVKQKINLNNISQAQKIKELFEIEKEIKSKNVPARIFLLSDVITKKYFVNSEDIKIMAEIPQVDLFYVVTVKEGAKSIQRSCHYGESRGWECFKEWKLKEKIKQEVKVLQENLLYGKKSPKGVMDVVVGPEITGIMVHESTGHPYEADRIMGREAAQAGESFVTKDMIGTKIGSSIVNVVDDPTTPNSYGFYLYDDEGVKARRKYLIKDGKINELLHNRETAFKMGLSSNGSARACDFDVEAIVRMSNTFMLPGDYTENEIIRDTKYGVYIKNFMEWNIDDLRFNQKYVGCEAYLIKNGEIKNPIRNPIIEITTPKLYSSIDALTKKVEFHAGECGKGEPMQSIPVWMGGPTIRLKNIIIK